jgi:hypothetical protein
MFAVHCPTCNQRVLLSSSRVRGMVSTDRGIIVKLECHDGTPLYLLTGRRAAA